MLKNTAKHFVYLILMRRQEKSSGFLGIFVDRGVGSLCARAGPQASNPTRPSRSALLPLPTPLLRFPLPFPGASFCPLSLYLLVFALAGPLPQLGVIPQLPFLRGVAQPSMPNVTFAGIVTLDSRCSNLCVYHRAGCAHIAPAVYAAFVLAAGAGDLKCTYIYVARAKPLFGPHG